MQRVVFGMALDGQSGWTPRDGVGTSTLGPLGFLALLETHLGLIRTPLSDAERIVQYRDCLSRARTGGRFYERSFAVDELGTAATLLRWRDDWHLCGWIGQAGADAPARIRDMQDVERLAVTTVEPGIGQRLVAVASALGNRRVPIEHVELVDPFDALPSAWRQVLALLPVVHRAEAAAQGDAGTLLRELQASLLAVQAGRTPSHLNWRDDGSVLVVRAESRIAAAQWLARRVTPGDRTHLVVAPGTGSMLDAALEAANLPRMGLGAPSPFRPAQQLLPLTLRLLWLPVDFDALGECLTLPAHPVTRRTRRHIAEHLVRTPGLAGARWDELKASIAEDLGDRAEAELAAVAFWIEPARHDPAQGVPLPEVLQRVSQLAEFFRARLDDPDDTRRAACSAGHAQALAMRQGLQRLLDHGMERIGPDALETLLQQATGPGTRNPLHGAQAGAAACVTRAAAVIEPFETVTWWQLAAEPLPKPPPLGRDEVDALRALGVELHAFEEVLRRDALASLRPILMARRRLILVLPRPGEEVHPIWLGIAGLFESEIPVHRVEDRLTTLPQDPAAAVVPFKPLPTKRRWWRLPDGRSLAWPGAASFSSLEPLLFNPSLWVLRYPARLKRSALIRPPRDHTLFGTLAHRLVERLYREPGSVGWDEARVSQWVDDHIDRIVDEEGALLRMPGRRADLMAFARRLRRSIPTLHRRLRAAGAERIEPERVLNGETAIGTVRGFSDLVVETSAGRRLIIDMKWAGLNGYRDRLVEQRHLQLAVYAHLLEQETGTLPAVGYYVLKDAVMLLSEPALVPGLDGVAHPDGATPALWQQAVTTWSWRKAQLEAGWIEVVIDDSDADADSVPPDGGLRLETLNAAYNEFARLTGWPEA